MHSNVTELFPGKRQSPPVLRKIGWLAELLGLSEKQTYEAIASKHVPPECILRVGRRIRIIEERAIAWILNTDQVATSREKQKPSRPARGSNSRRHSTANIIAHREPRYR